MERRDKIISYIDEVFEDQNKFISDVRDRLFAITLAAGEEFKKGNKLSLDLTFDDFIDVISIERKELKK